MLQANVAAVTYIGPCYMDLAHEEAQAKELQASLDALPSDVELSQKSRVEHQLANAVKRRDEAKAELDAAMAHLNATRLESSAAIARGLARDAGAYDGAIRAMAAAEGGVLDSLTAEAAQLVNTGELKVGEEVAVVAEGRIQRAEVRRAVDEAKGTYELSLWTEVSLQGQKYEAGFSTSQPKLRTVGRRDVYANRKQKQKLSKTALALAAARAAVEARDGDGGGGGGAAAPPPPSPAPSSPEFLALLYLDAEHTL